MDEQVKDKNADSEHAAHKDSALDEGLEGTFPASDPAASNAPGSTMPSKIDEKNSPTPRR